jgi:hypothetical protein
MKTNQKQSIFINWLDLSKKSHESEQVRQKQLKMKVMISLNKHIEIKEKKQHILVACRNHMQSIKMKNIFESWLDYIDHQKKFRNHQMHIYQKLDKFRLRLVYKHWFNQIDILKRWRFLNENTEAWYLRKMRKRIFKAWRNQNRL